MLRFRGVLLGTFTVALVLGGATATATATAPARPGDTEAAVSISKQTGKRLAAKARKQAVNRARKACRGRSGRAKRTCVRRRARKLQKRIYRQLVRQLPGKPAPKITARASFTARGSVGDAYVLGAKEGDLLLLVNRDDRIVRSRRADSFGSKVFYDVKPDPDYTVRLRRDGEVFGTPKFRILKPDANPKQSFYAKQTLKPGLNFVRMRDGIELAVTVRLPPGVSGLGGATRHPAVVEHSGYGTAAPHDLLASFMGGASDPLAPEGSTALGGLLAPQIGFVSVSMQMRGTGCSGGAFDLFGLPTTYDYYDVIELVGNQKWSTGRVGTVGASFSGITQLFAAGVRPPHLKAVTPMSVTDDLYEGTGYPGGIFNKGFALSWITDRVHDARPAPGEGQPWAREMITNGDPQVPEPLRSEQKQHCLKNQTLRLQTRPVLDLIKQNPFRTPQIFANRAPGRWLAKAKVPVFLAGAFQDEQTGGRFAHSLPALKGKPDVWIVMQNGTHIDSVSPDIVTQWVEFLNLFVGDRVPRVPPMLLGLGGVLYQALADSPSLPVADSRYSGYPDTREGVARAKADFRKDYPRVRLLMENGAATVDEHDSPAPGGLGAAWEVGFKDWPVPGTRATTWFLGPNGGMTLKKPPARSLASYSGDYAARPNQTLPGSGAEDAFKAQPPYDWAPVANGRGVGFLTPALDRDTLVAGAGSVDLWLRSSARDTDLQVTLTEVRPDGNETYVQNGWLRASHRKLDRQRSTAIEPVPTHLKADAAAMPAGKFALVRVPLFPVGHMFRAGSKIRLNVQAPGGDRPRWDFDTIEKGTVTNDVLLGGAKPSRLVLSVIPGVTASGRPMPAPTALRGQPSRVYVPATNGG